MAFINIGQVVYPVGSIYISTDPTSPSSLFGGEWEVIADAYLRAIGTTGVTVGEYGGYQDYTLTIEQIPSHKHTLRWGKQGQVSNTNTAITALTNWGDTVGGTNVAGGANHSQCCLAMFLFICGSANFKNKRGDVSYGLC